MHQTSFVDAESGRYVLQRLHPKLATKAILADYQAVTLHLAAKGEHAPRLIQPNSDALVIHDEHGHWWRLTTRVSGRTHDKVINVKQAEAGARALGRFHRAMADFEHSFGSNHPLHDTQGHLNRLRVAAADPAYAQARATIDAEIETIVELLPPLVLPDTLPSRVVHGDPKISNIMFEGDEAVGLIDLDTCNRHSVLVDLGDAVRSWCRDGAEDERQHFLVDRFEAMLCGYAAEGLALTDLERHYLVGAGRLITLELASRFARDVLEDEYFGYDTERYACRRDHNQARTRAMIFLADDMHRHQLDIERLVKSYLV